ncbi:MAG: hypothetical protein LBK99_07590 [Opitutaceae bacterium]|jgi:hypothetical protein|nr:hypothetical protein [Opitutaceae bacterium]
MSGLGYELVLGEAAVFRLVAASKAEQRRIGRLLDRIKAEPFWKGDLRESDTEGRIHEIVLDGDWLVTFWTDHAAREVRVVRIEEVDD